MIPERFKGALLVWFSGLGVLIIAGLVYYFLILDWQGRPFCHKQISLAFLQAIFDQKLPAGEAVTNAFPNVNGRSWESLTVIRDNMDGDINMRWARGYRYVPGLRADDPGDLVLMYLDQPTRWTWHGTPPTIFEKKAWIVVPVDFVMADRPRSGPGESSERIAGEEFRRRLQRTLDFLRTNERPHWEAVVAEHEAFLKSATTPHS